jgi:hypothetical protein
VINGRNTKSLDSYFTNRTIINIFKELFSKQIDGISTMHILALFYELKYSKHKKD